MGKNVISEKMLKTLKRMKGFRNLSQVGEIDDSLVFGFLKNNLSGFSDFKKEILDFLKRNK